MAQVAEASVDVSNDANDANDTSGDSHQHTHEVEHEGHSHDLSHDHSHDLSHDHSHDHSHEHSHDHSHDHSHGKPAVQAERVKRSIDYDLLEERGAIEMTTDPGVKRYFQAKSLFKKGYELAKQIPESDDVEVLMQHHQQIVDATKYLVEAFILDEKATDMPQRVMTLAQQYEKLLKSRYSKDTKKDEEPANEDGDDSKKDENDKGDDSKKDENDKGVEEKTKETETDKENVVTEVKEEKGDDVGEAEDEASKAENIDDFEPEFTKESLVLVIWLLFNGKQYEYCIQTLNLAYKLEPELRPRFVYLRASCYLALRDHKSCIKDLERLIALDPTFVDAYSLLGTLYMQRDDRLEAIRYFKMCVDKSHKDSASYSQALYALSVLNSQNASATGAPNNRNQILQNLRNQQATSYYKKAKDAEKRFEELYGRAPEMSETKRLAVSHFDAKTHKSQPEPEIPAALQRRPAHDLIGESVKKCNNCQSTERKEENGALDHDKKSKLLRCSGCGKVYYCSKECQKKNWKGHKQACLADKIRK